MAQSTFNLRSFEYAFMHNIFLRVHYLRKPLLEGKFSEVGLNEDAGQTPIPASPLVARWLFDEPWSP
jgi:hypothetical protein